MFEHRIQLRVRYAETDKMGYCYYGNYAEYFEVARVEMLRSTGLTYRQMEDDGIFMPVLEFYIKYIKPAFYDDLLNIVIRMKEWPSSRIKFEYETYNEKNELLNIAHTTLVFVSGETGKPCNPPDYFLEKLRGVWKTSEESKSK